MNENIQIELKDNFAFLISSLSSPRDIQQFFETFLTDEEKTMLTKRLMLHLMLENGYSIVDIAVVLGLSRETVRVHHALWRNGGEVYKSIIARIAKRQKTKEFWESVEKALRPLEYMLQAKSNMRSRAKLLRGDFD